MRPQELDSLGEELLREGVAPRHVRSYLRELREHYEDALRIELKSGSSQSVAEATASGRLGDPNCLLQSALSRPELRSAAAQHPRMILGAGPSALWLLAVILMIAALVLTSDTVVKRNLLWALPVQHVIVVFVVRVLPVLLIVSVLVVAHRQRLSPSWPIFGAIMVVLLAGSIDIHYLHASTVAESSIGLGSALLPLFLSSPDFGQIDPVALVHGLVRATIIFVVSVASFLVWKLRVTLGSTKNS